ncbi:hypothetical protein ACQKIC_17580 [Peribacillus sp. NPDC046944]|uniref:hypothetical protein n=1 Tax=unclassified Peribacillus TaxID=2675266 RepID=UPI003D07C564
MVKNTTSFGPLLNRGAIIGRWGGFISQFGFLSVVLPLLSVKSHYLSVKLLKMERPRMVAFGAFLFIHYGK